MDHSVAEMNVSRETFENMHKYCDLVRKWTPKINLIAPGTIPQIWDRHLVDSAQIYKYAPKSFDKWVDIGSGGGFPGIVVAILGKELHPGATFILIESDQRKSTFLRSCIRELGLNAKVIADRIENVPSIGADVVSARALSTLSSLIPMIEHHAQPDGIAILHKGKRALEEVQNAQIAWRFTLEDFTSLTDLEAKILVLKGISSARH